ncbi:hypothetical protein [Tahibacter amnicola]|uniref:Uncharacterized protein n=1 Tax=Tahibacter amnicola TaxID=2976241 RepID=A0ABY6B953_9GAMM|nr:hypothetical protein [Tahibacter amnicola]UXI66591.1 hypothetical protein N4264_17790 [Tahibacter amnicola]
MNKFRDDDGPTYDMEDVIAAAYAGTCFIVPRAPGAARKEREKSEAGVRALSGLVRCVTAGKNPLPPDLKRDVDALLAALTKHVEACAKVERGSLH